MEPDAPQGPAILLTSPQGLLTLQRVVGDQQRVHLLATGPFHFYDELAHASPEQRARAFGAWAGGLRLPPRPDPLGYPGLDIELLTRYDEDYPASFFAIDSPPLVLRRRGRLPGADEQVLAVAGPRWPSPEALWWARLAATMALEGELSVVALLDGGCGTAVLTRCVELGARALAIIPRDPALALEHEPLTTAIVAAGGGVLSEWSEHHLHPERRLHQSARLAAALASAVLVCEAGLHPSGGAELVRRALELGRPLASPKHRNPTELERSGGQLLVDPSTASIWAQPPITPAPTALEAAADLAAFAKRR